MTLFYLVWTTVFGLLIGSFLNVCIYRLPRGENIALGHSYCPKCGHNLGAADLVPVFSYLLLGRRCRYCREPISSRYAGIEILTAAAFGLAAGVVRPDWPDSRLLLTVTLGAYFAASLVWAMIRRDSLKPPTALFAFILVPIILAIVIQPEKWWVKVLLMLTPLLVDKAINIAISRRKNQQPAFSGSGRSDVLNQSRLIPWLPLAALLIAYGILLIVLL
jgi:prepilin signal peptidase PulO-like enzyme (type II secretory pathway)